jgi:hypothetical protein
MTTQNYLVVESSVVTNIVVWDGDTNTWQPPADATMLVQATTPAMVWEAVLTDGKITGYQLVEQIGAGQIGFTWNGTVLTTNKPEPAVPTQPVSIGTKIA